MRLDFSKAVFKSLLDDKQEHLYINVGQMMDGSWCVCWEPEYLGAYSLADAQRLRSLWLKRLRGKHPDTGKAINPHWNKRTVRTIRVI